MNYDEDVEIVLNWLDNMTEDERIALAGDLVNLGYAEDLK